ncbi:S1/P1 nuclease [Bradyrhizobium sp. USDA 4461]
MYGARPTDAARADALRFAVHFIGDLHQPLHTVLEARGGNDVHVTSSIHGNTCSMNCNASTNLHAFWDSGLILKVVWDWGAYVDRLETGWLNSAEANNAEQGTLQDWAEQTHAEATTIWNAVPPDKTLADNYYQLSLPVLDRQLGRAGLRLARFLNESYAPGSCPIQ